MNSPTKQPSDSGATERWLPAQFAAVGHAHFIPTNNTDHRSLLVKRHDREQVYLIRLVAARLFSADGFYRFRSQLEALSQVRTQGFQRPVEWGVENEWVWCAHEFSDTMETLQTVTTGTNPPEIDADRTYSRITRQAIELLKTISAIHRAGSLQQDLRPSQLLFSNDCPVLVCPSPMMFVDPEFRPAKWSMRFAEIASPELAGAIDQDVGVQSDLYSIGVVIFRLLTGRLPFEGSHIGEILLQHLTAEPDFSYAQQRNDGSEAPATLIQIVEKMLLKEPRDRYQSAEAVIADLEYASQIMAGQRSGSQFAAGRFDVRETVTDPSFVGRRNELEAMEQQLESSAHGLGRAVVVQCPSGMGKTRLVVESLRFASRCGFQIYRSQGLDQVALEPGGPIVQIIEQLKPQIHLHERLRNTLAHHEELVRRLLPEFAQTIGLVDPSAGDALPRHRGGAAESDLKDFGQNRAVGLFCKILSCLGSIEHPALIWFDDCQWFEPQTMEVLKQLLAAVPQHTHLILSLRDTDPAICRTIESMNPDLMLEPQRLEDHEIQALIESMAGCLPEEAIQVSTSLSSGSPFMASAIIRGMVESRALYCNEGIWKIDSDKMSAVKASSGAAELLSKRLENVQPEMLQLLSVAAISGKEFEAGIVAALCDLTVEASRECVNGARLQRLIWAKPDGKLAFVHDKIRETLLARLSPKRRQKLHQKIGDYLASHHSWQSSDIAFHYDAAEAYTKAYPFATEAADRALESFSLSIGSELLLIARRGVDESRPRSVFKIETRLAHTLMLDGRYIEAEVWFKSAAEIASNDLQRADIATRLAELMFKRGNKQEAVDALETALRSLGGNIPGTRILCVLALLKELSVQAMHTLLPRWFIARKKCAASKSVRLRWDIYSRLSRGYWYTRDQAYVFVAHLRAMNEAETFPPTPELGQIWSEHAPGMSLIPLARRGIRYARRSIRLRRDLKDVWGEGQSRGFYSILLYSISRLDECVDQARQAEAVLLKTGDYWEVNIARYQLAAALMRKGHFAAAKDFAKQTYESALKLGDFQSTGNIIDVWARASLGQIPASVIELEESRSINDAQRSCQILLAKGVRAMATEEYTDAVACFEDAIQCAKKAGVINAYTVANYAWLATGLRMQWETGRSPNNDQRSHDADRLYQAARTSLKYAKRFTNELPHAWREMAMAEMVMGRARRARRAFEKSLKIANRQGATYEAALTRVAYGQCGKQFGWPHHEEILSVGKTQTEAVNSELRGDKNRGSMSLMDRFESLLDAGRQISSSVNDKQIFKLTLDAARNLLRGCQTMIVCDSHADSTSDINHDVNDEADNRAGKQPQWEVNWQNGHEDANFNLKLVLDAVHKGHSVIQDKMTGDEGEFRNASLCSPIQVNGKTVACLYASNRLIKGFYGANEIRIADYLTSAAGAALEKADGFNQLEGLNRDLEKRVADRTRVIEARSNELEYIASELTKTKEKLETARDDAQAASVTKSQFLARMSHEIRTPISAVIGFTDLMLRGAIKDPAEQLKKLETIQSSGQHLLELVNDLLDISKIEAGKLEVESIQCLPASIVREVVDSVQARAQQNGNELLVRFEGLTPKTILSDPKRLKQIITNIVGNAIKFTRQGRVTTTVRIPVVEEKADPKMVEIEVADTGIGMNKGQIEKIFDPFVQADSTVTRRFGGTGLGLSISQKLAISLGGSISVCSVPHEGTTFRIRIPTGIDATDQTQWLSAREVEGMLEEPLPRHGVRVNLAGKTVFYADDAETNRDLIALLLSDCGATVVLAEDGAEAYRRLTDRAAPDYCGDCDLVLMDMQMPVIDGYTATTMLREFGFTKTVVAFTANSMTGDREKCIECGCNDFLSKPIDVNLLLEKVARICGVEVVPVTHPSSSAPLTIDADIEQSLNDRLSGLGDVMRPFAHKFLGKLQGRMEGFRQAIAHQDQEQIHQTAHWAKGTAGTVGLTEIAHYAATIDQAAKVPDWDAIVETSQTLEGYLAAGGCVPLVNN